MDETNPQTQAALALYTPATAPLKPADPAAVSIAADPAKVPAPIGVRAPQTLKVRMETVELAGGFNAWEASGRALEPPPAG